jgi:hypothetical protein
MRVASPLFCCVSAMSRESRLWLLAACWPHSSHSFKPPYLLRKSELGGFVVLELTLGCYVDIGAPVACTEHPGAQKAVQGWEPLPKFSEMLIIQQ